MKAALHRIFRKNLLLLLVIISVFIGVKCLTAHSIVKQQDAISLLNSWVEQCLTYNDAELESFIQNSASQLAENKDGAQSVKAARSAFFTSYSNRKELQKLISFAQNREGILPYSLPDNYLQLLDFYSGMNTPQIINEIPLDVYFTLQKSNVIPLLVLLLSVILWGTHYEAEIYKYAVTAKHGKTYCQTTRWTLLLLSLLLLSANELFDLAYSQLLTSKNLLSASVQSYTDFSDVQMNCSIKTAFVIMWCSKVLNVICLVMLSEYIAQKKKNLKDAAVYTALSVIAVLFLKNALLNTPYYAIIQLGYVDWKQLIQETVVLLPTRIPSLLLGITVSSFVTAGLILVCHTGASK